ncbi:hypothetical protein WEI85_00495 [Actinomycetes bacterium KLBMP 9797]
MAQKLNGVVQSVGADERRSYDGVLQHLQAQGRKSGVGGGQLPPLFLNREQPSERGIKVDGSGQTIVDSDSRCGMDEQKLRGRARHDQRGRWLGNVPRLGEAAGGLSETLLLAMWTIVERSKRLPLCGNCLLNVSVEAFPYAIPPFTGSPSSQE